MAPNPATLTSLRTEVRDLLSGTSAQFADAQVNQAILQALREFNTVTRYRQLLSHTVTIAKREQVVALARSDVVERVWLPFTAAAPEDPPNDRPFDYWPDQVTIYIKGGTTPAVGDVARVFYNSPHTLNGLEAATATTFGTDDNGALVYGAAADAVNAKRREISQLVTLHPGGTDRDLLALAKVWRANFQARLDAYKNRPAGGWIEVTP